MKRAIAAVVLLLCCCSLRAARNNASTCNSDQQCGGGNVCFLGQCRGHSASLGFVSVEVQPSGSSAFAVLQASGLNLQQSVVQNFALLPSVMVHGTVSQQQDQGGTAAVSSSTVTFTSHAPIIADRVQQTSAQADGSGAFTVRLPRDLFDANVRPPAPDPPFDAPQLSTADAGTTTSFSAVLPAESELVKVQGAIDAGGESLAGASVTALDGAGDLISSPAQVTAGNNFTLSLPPGTNSYLLAVGPPASFTGGGGTGTGIASLPSYQLPGSSTVVLTLPQVTSLTGTVIDSTGAPLGGIPVFARSTSAEPFTLARSVNTASNGTFSLTLRAGEYLVEAAPPATNGLAGLSASPTISVPPSGVSGLVLTCPPKVTALQRVQFANGKFAGPGFQIAATRAADTLVGARTAVTSATDANGLFQITGDPGEYRVEITPPSGLLVPRHIAQIELLPNSVPQQPISPFIVLDAPLTVVGTVHGTPPGGTDGPLAGATVSFFALDASGASVLLGSAVTDQSGNYTSILPDIANP